MFFNSYNNVSVNSNTVKVNGKTITLPRNYNSLSIINGDVYIDGVKYDGNDIKEVKERRKKEIKTIDFDETIISISADFTNVNVEIVNDKKSSVLYDSSEFDVNVSGGFITIKSKVDNTYSDINIRLSKRHLSSVLNLNVDYGNINFESKEELNTSLAFTVDSGNIKIKSDTTEDVTLICDNGNVKSHINCRETDIKVDNGNVKGTIRVKEDSTIRVDNGNVKICTFSSINDNVTYGSVKLNHRKIDESTIYVSIDNGNLKTKTL